MSDLKLWSWSQGRDRGMVAAHDDYEARALVQLLTHRKDRVWLIARHAGEAMPKEPCVVIGGTHA